MRRLRLRSKTSMLFFVAFLVLAVFQVLTVSAQERETLKSDYPEREEINKSFRLPAGARVEVSTIAGPVDVETTDGDMAEVHIIRTAQTRAELDCYRTVVELTAAGLSIRHEQHCSNVRGYQSVKLTLPRSTDLSLKNIAGSVRLGAIDGMLRLNSIAGQVTASQVQRAEILSLAAGLTIGLAQPDKQGIRISSITGGIDLSVGDGVNTNIVVTSLRGEIQNDASEASVTKTGESNFNVLIGSGGTPIRVSSIVGGMKIHQ